jgi:ABC-type transporter Mla subunit MlaD
MAERTERLEGAVQEQLAALARVEASVADSVATTRQEVARRETDVAEVLGLVSELCGQAMDLIEANREEHDVFLASLAQVVRPLIAASESATPKARPGATVLGGTVSASIADVDLGEIEACERSDASDAVVDEPPHGPYELPFR